MKRIRSEEYKERQRNLKKIQRDERRFKAIQLLGGKCVSCGCIDNLHFDHIDRKTKKFPISVPPSEAKFWEELKKCQILCSDCHRKKSIFEMQGERGPTSKLNRIQVQQIRHYLELGIFNGSQLAKMFDIGPMEISRIKNRKRWAHVE